MTQTTRTRRALASAAVCLALLTGCKVDTTVSIRSDDDGRGRVSVRVDLDAEAAFALQADGVALEQRVKLDDLDDAGWTVSPWRIEDSGAASVRLTKDFVGEDQLAGILDELAGEGGVLGGAHIDRSRGMVRSRDGLSVEADLTSLESGLAGDEEVARRLADAGVDVAALDAGLTEGLDSAFGLSVVLSMGDERRAWHLLPGDEKSLVVSTSRIEWDRITTLGIAAILTLLAALLFLAAWVSARRRRRGPRGAGSGGPVW
ncbi:MAG: hypothetical protein M5T61_04975 [Acidimicrobiia bacterium]|nr:hypothetical protein [Acidimicrobiia bacterium]